MSETRSWLVVPPEYPLPEPPAWNGLVRPHAVRGASPSSPSSPSSPFAASRFAQAMEQTTANSLNPLNPLNSLNGPNPTDADVADAVEVSQDGRAPGADGAARTSALERGLSRDKALSERRIGNAGDGLLHGSRESRYTDGLAESEVLPDDLPNVLPEAFPDSHRKASRAVPEDTRDGTQDAACHRAQAETRGPTGNTVQRASARHEEAARRAGLDAFLLAQATPATAAQTPLATTRTTSHDAKVAHDKDFRGKTVGDTEGNTEGNTATDTSFDVSEGATGIAVDIAARGDRPLAGSATSARAADVQGFGLLADAFQGGRDSARDDGTIDGVGRGTIGIHANDDVRAPSLDGNGELQMPTPDQIADRIAALIVGVRVDTVAGHGVELTLHLGQEAPLVTPGYSRAWGAPAAAASSVDGRVERRASWGADVTDSGGSGRSGRSAPGTGSGTSIHIRVDRVDGRLRAVLQCADTAQWEALSRQAPLLASRLAARFATDTRVQICRAVDVADFADRGHAGTLGSRDDIATILHHDSGPAMTEAWACAGRTSNQPLDSSAVGAGLGRGVL